MSHGKRRPTKSSRSSEVIFLAVRSAVAAAAAATAANARTVASSGSSRKASVAINHGNCRRRRVDLPRLQRRQVAARSPNARVSRAKKPRVDLS